MSLVINHDDDDMIIMRDYIITSITLTRPYPHSGNVVSATKSAYERAVLYTERYGGYGDEYSWSAAMTRGHQRWLTKHNNVTIYLPMLLPLIAYQPYLMTISQYYTPTCIDV